MISAYRCAYCSQWNPSLKARPQLAISYDQSGSTQNNCMRSTETIQEITDEMSLRNNSDTNESEHLEPKDNLITGKIYCNVYGFHPCNM